MPQKTGCEYNPECLLVECGRACAKAVFHNGTCHRDVKTFPKGFLDSHGIRRGKGPQEGKLLGHHAEKFHKKHLSWGY